MNMEIAETKDIAETMKLYKKVVDVVNKSYYDFDNMGYLKLRGNRYDNGYRTN